MKKWLSLLFVVTAMLFLSAGMVQAANSVAPTPGIILDGKVLKSTVPPVLMEASVMIPVRIVTENLGYKVDYDNKMKQVKISNGIKQLVMTIDKPTAYLDNEPLKLVMPPTLQSSITLIPLRFLGESLGIQVFWDNTSKSAFLYSPVPAKDSNNGSDKPNGEIVGGIEDNDNVGTNPEPSPEVIPDTNTDPGTVENQPITLANLHDVRYESGMIIMKYDGILSPHITVLDNPKRIVVDLPDTNFAPDFLPPLPSSLTVGKQAEFLVAEHPALQSVRYSIFSESPRTLRFVLDLNQAWDYELQSNPLNGEFSVILKEPVFVPDKSLYTIVLDAGHGGSDPGAESVDKRWEKEFNLSVVTKVQALLAGDERINLVLTRQDDTYPSLDDRFNLANNIGADLFISVHANSFTAKTNGTETYYSRDDSLAFAKAMHSLLTAATGLKDNGVRQSNFKVIRYTTMPAILLESGYLSSAIDNPVLWSTATQDRIANAIATGIKQYLKLS